MRTGPSFALVLLALTAGAVPAQAFRAPEPNAPWPTEHQLALREADKQTQPYAMNYTDEAAQKLGVRNGEWEGFSHSNDPVMLKGGMESGSPMLSLQWRPGQ